MGQQITVLADRGYFKGEEILRCSDTASSLNSRVWCLRSLRSMTQTS